MWKCCTLQYKSKFIYKIKNEKEQYTYEQQQQQQQQQQKNIQTIKKKLS